MRFYEPAFEIEPGKTRMSSAFGFRPGRDKDPFRNQVAWGGMGFALPKHRRKSN